MKIKELVPKSLRDMIMRCPICNSVPSGCEFCDENDIVEFESDKKAEGLEGFVTNKNGEIIGLDRSEK